LAMMASRSQVRTLKLPFHTVSAGIMVQLNVTGADDPVAMLQ
jgi:hypothetical protein